MEPFRDDNDLIAELRTLRPRPSQEFTTGLDERAAAGFPRRSARPGSPLSRLSAWLRTLPPRRLALSVTATALAAVAVATVIVAVNEPGKDPASLAQVEPTAHRPNLTPMAESTNSHLQPSTASSGQRHAGGGDSSTIEYNAAPPTATEGETASGEESSGLEVPAGGSAGVTQSNSSAATGPFASEVRHRDVERSAEMVLGADPDRVADDSAQVFDAVHAAKGIVLSSSVAGGAAGDAGARFELLIPAAKLGDALAAFSSIDTVVSRHEATGDITAPTVRVGEHLRDSRAKIDGLLVQLAGADSDSERAEVEAELSAERHRAASLRSQATKLGRRANLSRVSLRIETGSGAATGGSGGDWGIGDAFHDAGHILAIAAGVAIVGLAIVGPLLLIALLIWIASRARLRRARERALK
ncbi:MAG TPA: DUF4349 domain-containing protein [Solirubrobacterales bacterium]|jgi:hypothetical protein|nr:DUF4349 domain-containing protein [Solirubrobacterales bacterium]